MSNGNQINIFQNKTLKLSNVLTAVMNLENDEDINNFVLKMENYIKSKGAILVGPLIQKTQYYVGDDGTLKIKIYMMLQVNKFIHNVEKGKVVSWNRKKLNV